MKLWMCSSFTSLVCEHYQIVLATLTVSLWLVDCLCSAHRRLLHMNLAEWFIVPLFFLVNTRGVWTCKTLNTLQIVFAVWFNLQRRFAIRGVQSFRILRVNRAIPIIELALPHCMQTFKLHRTAYAFGLTFSHNVEAVQKSQMCKPCVKQMYASSGVC